MRRTIMHADLDAFYASVEQLDHPEFRGKPVVVGGPAESRGVVAAASYEARAFGVRSAMPMIRALRLCPDAIRASPRFERYGEMSRQVMAIFRALTPLVEPLSLDEAYLDVSGWVDDGAQPLELARALKAEVKQKTQLNVSIGVGANKSVAKIASDAGKPDGLVVVSAGEEAAFLAPMPVRALWGIGPKTAARIEPAGVRTIGDLAHLRDADAERLLGSAGLFFRDMARGIDNRTIETEHERKSIGAETTFAQDLADGPELREALARIGEEVASRMDRAAVRARTVALKLRYSYFKTISRQASPKQAVASAGEIIGIATMLLDQVVEEGDRFRLLGIQCSRLIEAEAVQAPLWEAAGAPTAES